MSSGFGRRFDQLVELFLVTEGDDLLVILGHLLEDDAHLLLTQAPGAEVELGEGTEDVAIGAGETDTVINRSGLNSLLRLSLVLLEDANKSFDRPNRVRAELMADIGGNVLIGEFHDDQYGHLL